MLSLLNIDLQAGQSWLVAEGNVTGFASVYRAAIVALMFSMIRLPSIGWSITVGSTLVVVATAVIFEYGKDTVMYPGSQEMSPRQTRRSAELKGTRGEDRWWNFAVRLIGAAKASSAREPRQNEVERVVIRSR